MEQAKHSFTPLRDVLSGLLSSEGLLTRSEKGKIWAVWKDVVGSDMASDARPLWIRKRKLRVAVREPGTLQYLRLEEEKLRKVVNEKLGQGTIDKIEFRPDMIPEE
jgi:predicted nucleic acid-binding Zn ribbon protein